MQHDNDDISKLLEIASQKTDPEKPQEKLSEVQQWIAALGIKPGTHMIRPQKAYWEYKKWAKKPIPFLTFSAQLKKAFKQHREACPSGQNPYYLVCPDQFDITLDDHFLMLAESRARRAERRRKSLERKKKLEGR